MLRRRLPWPTMNKLASPITYPWKMLSEKFSDWRGTRILSRLEGGDHWNDIGINQFNFLVGEGLKPHHYLLDVACGSFRAGRLLIPYMEKGHYFGFDRSRKHLDAGMRYVLKPLQLIAKKPFIQQIELTESGHDYARKLGWSQFNFIWVHAVLDHMPHPVIRQCLKDFSRILNPGGHLYATIFLNPYGPDYSEPILHLRNGSSERAVFTHPDKEYWHHTIQFFEETISEISGLKLEGCLSSYPHPLGLQVLKFTCQI